MALIFNEESFKQVEARLIRELNAELQQAAKPIIEKALADIEKAMRERMGACLISQISNNLDMNFDGRTLNIRIHQAK
jgi:hypothetical protein